MTDRKGAALITGASRGIGAAIARRLAEDGWLVIGTATSAPGADRISAALADVGGRGLVMDVIDAASVQAALNDIQAREGTIEVLVNNAGITRDNLLMRMKDEEWDSIIDTNLTAAVRLTQKVLKPMMKARNGRIILIGSVVGSSGNAGQTNYAAAKAGLAGFARALAREVGSRNITVNTVAPGFIDTDMTRELGDETRAKLLEGIPLGRLGAPEEIAAAVAFLASRDAGYITGETLHVNGGMFMH
ncbi:3-oxoacyl-[acyl-carrier protein] reductase [Thioalkalivibrio nitratireducens DSM 14787]|uniref:3-oxoacyl-[acyl-carrier-protein] reductase n=1 Tax=Thioalkalivibrio nitratireducens (strain DSM 14787 / UNIQEM 213 / ALEN2) TaxID=1255043 RepID=L0DW55_THIND|nr:3-oxoacyl-ACP reductase FabG [Thioalkalivibrio nitratireducens]AGA33247.1 3-oxoacyl-[acyl-carrier protein] reductase [Thioalkalivibrio nitratireducens DSM 14787]